MAGRRGNNEGSFQRREDGTWRVQLRIPGGRLSFSARTRQECAEWVKKTRAQIDGGLTYAGANMTLREYMDTWLQTVKENRRIKTYLQYQDIVDRYIQPNLGKVKLKDLQPIKIQHYLTSLQEKGIGDRTAQIIYSVLHAALAKALKMGLIGRNPLEAVEKPKIKNPKKKVVLDSEQVRHLLIAAEETRLGVLFHLAVNTGMREGEILGLMWGDVDWLRNTIKIQRQVQRVPKQGLVFSPPKTDAGSRMIHLGRNTINKLADHRQQQIQEKMAAGEKWQETGLIFTSKVGTAIDPRNLLLNFKKVLSSAGLANMRFHDLRHTSITLLLNEVGVPIKEAQRRAGHTRPSTTMDIYGGDVSSQMDENAAQSLDEIITPIKLDLNH